MTRCTLAGLIIMLAAISFAADLHVSCAPGLRVYLDDELVGTSSAEEQGLVLDDVADGLHTIRVERDGYLARTFQVRLPFSIEVGELQPVPDLPEAQVSVQAEQVEPAEPVSWTVVETAEAERIAETRKRAKGSLRLITRPTRCTVRFLGKVHEKTGMKLNLSFIPAGDYPILISCRGREMTASVTIEDRTRTIVEASFMPGDEPLVITSRPE
jgi:hypothetical protein